MRNSNLDWISVLSLDLQCHLEIRLTHANGGLMECEFLTIFCCRLFCFILFGLVGLIWFLFCCYCLQD